MHISSLTYTDYTLMILWCQMTPAKEKLGEEPGGHQANCKNSGDIVSVIILTGLGFNTSTDTNSPYRQILRLILFLYPIFWGKWKCLEHISKSNWLIFLISFLVKTLILFLYIFFFLIQHELKINIEIKHILKKLTGCQIWEISF